MIDTAQHHRQPACPMPRGVAPVAKFASCPHSGGRRRRPALRPPLLAVGALILALAGCEAQSGDADAAADAGQAEAQPAASGTGQPAVEGQLSTADCRTPSEGRVHFRLQDVVFAVPGNDIQTVLPRGVTPDTPAEQVIDQLRRETAEGAGCPETPLEATFLAVAGPAGDPLVADTLMLFRSGGIAGPYGNLLREMMANSERCQRGEGGLLACQVVEQDGAEQTDALYLVSTEQNRRLTFGGPLATRCVLADQQIRGCEIVDELPGGIGLRAPLRA